MEKRVKLRINPISLRRAPLTKSFELLALTNDDDNTFIGVIKEPPAIYGVEKLLPFVMGNLDCSSDVPNITFVACSENDSSFYIFSFTGNGHHWYSYKNGISEILGIVDLHVCDLTGYDQSLILAKENQMNSFVEKRFGNKALKEQLLLLA